MALSKLRGPAETWHYGLPSRLFSWDEWKNMLLEHFIPKRDLHADMFTMLNCVPQTHESLYEYSFKKLALINKMKIPLTDADKVNLIMGGIKNEQIRFSVETAEVSNPAKLSRFLKVFDKKNLFNENSTVNINRPSTSQSTTMRPKPSLSSSVQRCFFCQKRGHIKSQCPYKKNTYREVATYNANHL